MTYSSIKINLEEKVAVIILNRPEVLNSFNRNMALELVSALEFCGKEKNIRAVLLTGEGRGFSAGQDLAEACAQDAPPIEKIVREHYNPIIRAIRNLEKPVVCAINGVAAGAGANIALCCDIVLAARSAVFIQSFGKIGLVPDSGGTFFLPRHVGFQRASAMMLLGEKIISDQALSMGLLYKVFDDEKLISEALIVAATLSNLPTRGLALTKKALNQSYSNSLEQQLELEGNLQGEAGKTSDFGEGIRAFLEKRKPMFTGQ